MKNVLKIWKLLTASERKKALIVGLLVLLAAVADAVGIASVIPFLTVLGDPSMIEENEVLKKAYTFLNFKNSQDFIFALGWLTLFLIVISSSLQALSQYTAVRFSEMRRVSISQRLMKSYLAQPYNYFLVHNSGDLANNLLSAVDTAISRCLMPTVLIFSYGTHAFAIILLVLYVETVVGIATIILLSGSFSVIYLCLKKHFTTMGRLRLEANQQRFRVTNEVLGGIKEVKLHNLEKGFLDYFKSKTYDYSHYNSSNEIMSVLPRYGIQVLMYGGMMVLLMVLLTRHGNVEAILPTIGLLAFAGARLLPGFQNVYRSIAHLKFGLPTLEAILRDLALEQPENRNIKTDDPQKENRIVPQKSITLNHVSFAYPGTDKKAVADLQINIPVYTKVGIIGESGAGKTTAVDLILALYQPEKGALLVDDTVIDHDNRRAWQNTIGYVPQDIFLLDATVRENIAFGVSKDNIDDERVVLAAKQAYLHDFITEQLPKGYDTFVGERGVRLSGGQRQRIGIARTLYRAPSVIVLDEATSAVDNLTEKKIVKSIEALGNDRTVIMIAHRLNTVKNCDCIYMMENGKVIASGTYDELATQNEKFRSMLGN